MNLKHDEKFSFRLSTFVTQTLVDCFVVVSVETLWL